MKRLFSLLMVVAMMCTFLVVPASAETDPYVEIKATPASVETGADREITLEFILHNPDPAKSDICSLGFGVVSGSADLEISNVATSITSAFGEDSANYISHNFTGMKMKGMFAAPLTETEVTLLTVKATLKASAAAGSYEVKTTNMVAGNTKAAAVTSVVDAKVTITATAPIVKVTGVTLNKSTMSLVATAEETLTATVVPENATNKAVTWSTSNDKVAAVADGKVTAVAPGKATITVTTVDGSHTATCEVTVTEKPCEHPADKLTKVEAKEATCTEPGNAECWKCGECGKYLSADKSAVQDTICGYKPALGHEYGNLVAAVAPTCTVNGNVAYYQCSRCEKYFSADKNPITSIVAPATGHVIQHHDAVASTCVKEGNIEYWSCASCKKNFSDAEGKTLAKNVTLPVDASAHTIVNVPAKPHTCTEDGIIAHYKCTGCGKLFSDKAGENGITNIVDPAAHKLTPVAEKPSTCRVNGTGAYNKCEVCGKMFDKDTNKEITAVPVLELAAHSWDDVWHANSTGHYHECTVCGIAGDVTAHTPGAEATETTAQTCTVCGYIIKPATSHKEHTKGNLMSDATSHWYACTGCSEQLEKANHTVTSWTVDKAATTTEEGLRHGNCSVCQHVVYEKLAKINNTPVNPSKPGRPSGTKTVQSGKTFDAGVGVYVGLSILSLTGSAVVIGKKRKTR